MVFAVVVVVAVVAVVVCHENYDYFVVHCLAFEYEPLALSMFPLSNQGHNFLI